MAKTKKASKKPIEQYDHKGKTRVNNPPVGLVTPQTDKESGKKTYAYDPHLDPSLQWAGKAERTSFEELIVSLHVHERIDPRTVIEAVRKRNGKSYEQISLFKSAEENLPLRDAIEFYKHKHNWSNRIIAGDSLLVMNSLIEKEGLAGQVQMIYIDPPYGIKYGSNFQPFVNKRDVKDGKDEDLTQEPEMIKAFRDTWEMGIHSYLSYLRDRLLLARELLTESGSIFVQISDENVHLVRCLMDDVFGVGNFVSTVKFYTRSNVSGIDEPIADNIVWFAKEINQVKKRSLYTEKASKTIDVRYRYIELPNGNIRSLTKSEIEGKTNLPAGVKRFSISMLSSKSGGQSSFFPYEYKGQTFYPQAGRFWSTTKEGLNTLAKSNRLFIEGKNLKYKLYLDDFGFTALSNIWNDTVRIHEGNLYVVQTGELTIMRCLLMTTDPGDLVFDPTCIRKETGVWVVSAPTIPVDKEESPTPALSVNGEGEEGSFPVNGEGEKECLPPFTGGLRGATLVPIENLRPGNYVISHDGKPHRVLRIISRQYKGTMLGIWRSKSDKPLWVTPDHRILTRLRPRTLGGNRNWEGVPSVNMERAKRLRLEMTPPERILWKALRNGNMGFKFRRQHFIGAYIADFYSRSAHLIVEIDGISTHSGEKASRHDAERDAYLESFGLSVLRVSATDVLHNLEGVCVAIKEQCMQRICSIRGAEWVEARDVKAGDVVFYCPTPALPVDGEGEKECLPVKEVRNPTPALPVNGEGEKGGLPVNGEGGKGSFLVNGEGEKEYLPPFTGGLRGAVTFIGDEVQQITPIETQETVYDLEVEDAHSFLTEICIVHNCGSGTTAYVAEQWGRRWITCDTSRVAITLAKQRFMTALYNYYELAHPDEGVGSGFKYKTVPHITLKSIANNEPPAHETLYDQPFVDNSRARVTGPFTVEAVPSPVVKSLSPSNPTPTLPANGEGDQTPALPVDGEGKNFPPFTGGLRGEWNADESIARSGETLRQAEWRAELLKCGIRGKRGQKILFSRVEPLPGTRWLHAEAETKPNDLGADSIRETEGIYGKPQLVIISFGPEHAPLEQRQVELAWEEARTLVPRPTLLVFAAFQFDPEAAKDIDEIDTKKAGMTFLKVQMNADLLTEDLKKKRASNESFWLIGQPDVRLEKTKDGKDKGKYRVEILGFDYYNTKTGCIESGGTERIALWMLDTDYDGRSLFPRQVFFPMAGEKEGWARLAKNLKAEIDEELIEAYRGTVSLPFEAGPNRRIAVKIVDDRGIESLKILDVE